MTDGYTNKFRKIGSGFAEMPQDGRRFRFHIERYRHDDGTEWGQIVSMEEVPENGEPYLWIPSFGAETAEEVQYMQDEHAYERANPTAEQADWEGKRKETKARNIDRYNYLRDRRAEMVKRSPRTLGGNSG